MALAMNQAVTTPRRRSTLPPPARTATSWAPPFVGRVDELAGLRDALAVTPVAVIHGSRGAGKTALVAQLVAHHEVEATVVTCHPGDRAPAVQARAERRLRCAPGGVVERLTADVRVLVLDDVHHLPGDELARLVTLVAPRAGARGRLIVLADERPRLSPELDVTELELGGLDATDAAALWAELATRFGPAEAGDAHLRTRGLPLALRSAYARARFGDDAVALAGLPADARAVLAALAVVRVPVEAAALAVLVPEVELAGPLALLAAHQRIDGDARGRVWVHGVTEATALASLDVDARQRLERAAAGLLAPGAAAGAAVAGLDAIDRLRESALHWLAAGEVARAVALVEREAAATIRGGGAGELEAVVAAIGALAAPSLTGLQVELAARGGRIAEARERLAAGAVGVGAVRAAELAAAGLDVDEALGALAAVAASAPTVVDAQHTRGVAIARLVVLELARGEAAAARAQVDDALHEPLPAAARAELLVAQAAVEEHAADPGAARAALTRADGALAAADGSDDLRVIIAARRATALADEGRLTEPGTTLAEDAPQAAGHDAIAVAEAVIEARIALAALRGDGEAGLTMGAALVRARRARGDELGALVGEVALAELELRRGHMARAAELAHAAHGALVRARLASLAERTELVLAAVDLAEVRLERARPTLERLAASSALPARARATAGQLAAEARALGGQRAGAIEAARAAALAADELGRDLGEARVATVAGDIGRALAAARRVAAAAERSGRGADLAEALVIGCRLELAKGERAGARAQASRAAREAAAAGLVRSRCHALLALTSLARDDDDVPAAATYARDALELAHGAGLPVERLAATIALDSLAGADADSGAASGAAAAMTPQAIEATGRLLTDLGLTAVRPFRVIDATGAVSELADADPEVLRLAARTLAVDGVRETIWRRGTELADLRRRSLLKKLLFLFAAAPAQTFSKEDIVQSVWNVAYHPLRHDAALFTNIMRIRRLLGEDGAEIIRVTEDGYRFEPPPDFVFVQRAAATAEP
ncbi:MAG: winged helix-turn-helix domain-containing protein [Kofleriaceae bacterium]